MTTPANPSSPKSPNGRNVVEVEATTPELSSEERLHLFWEKNSKAVIAFVVIVIVAVLAKGGWDYLQAQKERDLGNELAAANTPEKLKAFAADHPGHPLAGLAKLKVADDAYAAGKSDEAAAAYDDAISALKGTPLANRARLGRAMAKVQGGKADGELELKAFASDATQPAGLRCEAAYNAASLAQSAGKPDEARKYLDLIAATDPQGAWGQRAMNLRAIIEAETPAAAPTASASTTIAVPKK